MSLFARELPPTAGLPMQASDFLPGGGDLREVLASQLGTPPLQLTCSGTHALLIDPSPGTSNSSKSGIIILSDILIQKETHQLLDKFSPQKSNAKPINVDTDDSDRSYHISKV